MRQLEQYVRGSQLPETKPKRPALLRPSSVPARTASGGLGVSRGEAQTPFRPVAQVAGVRQERYLNGAGRVAVDPSLVSYASYVATTGNVAVLDVSIPAEQLPQGRFFRFTSDVSRSGSDATPFSTPVLPDLDRELAVWELQNTNSDRLPGLVREERGAVLTFCIGSGSDKQSSSSFSADYGHETLSPSNRRFTFPTITAPNVSSVSLITQNVSSQLNPNAGMKPQYEQALIDAGAILSGFGYSLLIGVAYYVRQLWVGPSGYVQDSDTGSFVAVSDGQVLNEATSDGVSENPTRSISLTYRAF